MSFDQSQTIYDASLDALWYDGKFWMARDEEDDEDYEFQGYKGEDEDDYESDAEEDEDKVRIELYDRTRVRHFYPVKRVGKEFVYDKTVEPILMTIEESGELSDDDVGYEWDQTHEQYFTYNDKEFECIESERIIPKAFAKEHLGYA